MLRRLVLPLVVLVYSAPVGAQPTPTPSEPVPEEPAPVPAPATDPTPPEEQPPSSVQTVTDPTPPAISPATAAAPPARSDFMDTRLSFTCTHEDVLREEDVLPSAPGFHCGRPNQLGVLFFDNYDTRFSGYETLSHLALYKKVERGPWDAEAGVLIRINELAEDNIRLSDGGSYIRVAYWLDPTRSRRDTISLVTFPVSSDRMRLGYSYRISWGGSPEFFKANPDVPGSTGKNPDAVPGFKIQYDSDRAYGYVGLKSTLLKDPRDNEKKAVLAGLAGLGVDVTDMIRIEANGGLFDRGNNELEDVNDERVWLYGGSFQIAIHDGMPVGSSIDYKLYRNDPENIARLFRKEEYPGGLSWLASAEYTHLRQTLKDPSKPSSTTTQVANAADVNVRVKLNYTRARLDVMMRDLAYILHSTPSLPTYTDFPKDDPMTAVDEAYESSPEIFAAVGLDQYFPSMGLTAGVTLAVDLPATLKTPRPEDIPGNASTGTTLVVRNEANLSILPEGEDVAPIWAVKGSIRLDFADSFAALADVYYQRDENTVRYEREPLPNGEPDPEGDFHAVFANFDQLGFNITLQARF